MVFGFLIIIILSPISISIDKFSMVLSNGFSITRMMVYNLKKKKYYFRSQHVLRWVPNSSPAVSRNRYQDFSRRPMSLILVEVSHPYLSDLGRPLDKTTLASSFRLAPACNQSPPALATTTPKTGRALALFYSHRRPRVRVPPPAPLPRRHLEPPMLSVSGGLFWAVRLPRR